MAVCAGKGRNVSNQTPDSRLRGFTWFGRFGIFPRSSEWRSCASGGCGGFSLPPCFSLCARANRADPFRLAPKGFAGWRNLATDRGMDPISRKDKPTGEPQAGADGVAESPRVRRCKSQIASNQSARLRNLRDGAGQDGLCRLFRLQAGGRRDFLQRRPRFQATGVNRKAGDVPLDRGEVRTASEKGAVRERRRERKRPSPSGTAIRRRTVTQMEKKPLVRFRDRLASGLIRACSFMPHSYNNPFHRSCNKSPPSYRTPAITRFYAVSTKTNSPAALRRYYVSP